jgi:methylated-DNA-[protein]-cysteine S-methyltransferase
VTFQYKHIQSPLGLILIAANEEGVTGLWFDQHQHHPNISPWQKVKSQIWLDQCEVEIKAYFDANLLEFKTPLSVTWGTEFQQSVWQVLKQIPLGETISYGAVARRLKKPNAFRAVGAVTLPPKNVLLS